MDLNRRPELPPPGGRLGLIPGPELGAVAADVAGGDFADEFSDDDLAVDGVLSAASPGPGEFPAYRYAHTEMYTILSRMDGLTGDNPLVAPSPPQPVSPSDQQAFAEYQRQTQNYDFIMWMLDRLNTAEETDGDNLSTVEEERSTSPLDAILGDATLRREKLVELSRPNLEKLLLDVAYVIYQKDRGFSSPPGWPGLLSPCSKNLSASDKTTEPFQEKTNKNLPASDTTPEPCLETNQSAATSLNMQVIHLKAELDELCTSLQAERASHEEGVEKHKQECRLQEEALQKETAAHKLTQNVLKEQNFLRTAAVGEVSTWKFQYEKEKAAHKITADHLRQMEEEMSTIQQRLEEKHRAATVDEFSTWKFQYEKEKAAHKVVEDHLGQLKAEMSGTQHRLEEEQKAHMVDTAQLKYFEEVFKEMDMECVSSGKCALEELISQQKYHKTEAVELRKTNQRIHAESSTFIKEHQKHTRTLERMLTEERDTFTRDRRGYEQTIAKLRKAGESDIAQWDADVKECSTVIKQLKTKNKALGDELDIMKQERRHAIRIQHKQRLETNNERTNQKMKQRKGTRKKNAKPEATKDCPDEINDYSMASVDTTPSVDQRVKVTAKQLGETRAGIKSDHIDAAEQSSHIHSKRSAISNNCKGNPKPPCGSDNKISSETEVGNTGKKRMATMSKIYGNTTLPPLNGEVKPKVAEKIKAQSIICLPQINVER